MFPFAFHSRFAAVVKVTLFFLQLPSASAGPYRYDDGAHVTRDGIVNLVGFSGCVFQVINYLPVCGSFSPNLQAETMELSEKCTSAMSTYNGTDLTAAVYDVSGIESGPNNVGKGQELCICGSFRQSGDQSLDLCYWVDGKGFMEIWWSFSTDQRVASSSQRSSRQKQLPLCKDIDVNKLLQESKAHRDDSTDSGTSGVNTGSQPKPTPNKNSGVVPSKPSESSSSDATTSAPPAGGSRGGLESAKIWAPIVAAIFSIMFGAAGCWYKRKDSQRKKQQANKGEEERGIVHTEIVHGTVIKETRR